MTKMITPKAIDVKEIDQIIFKSFQKLVEITESNFALSYANWEAENKPEFHTSQLQVTGGKASVEYSTESAPYVLVDGGTKAHTEVAKNASFMKFPDRTIPKTRPGQLASFSGFSSNKFVSAKEVKNPGIKAREFSESVGKIMDEEMEKVVDKYHKEAKTL